MALLRTSRRPATRLERARGRLERTARARPAPRPSSLPRLLGSAPPRPASYWSTGSRWSALSLGSLASFASVGSLLSAGSVLSIGSAGSILSIGSVGSILSIGSAGSIFAIGAAGQTPGRLADDDGGITGTGGGTAGAVARLSPLTLLVRRAGTVVGACAVVAAVAS